MNSNLEKFIRGHRRDFDTELPSERVWEQVEKTIPVKKKEKVFSIRDVIKWSAAAAALVAIVTSGYFLYIKKSHEKQLPVAEQPLKQNPDYPAELNGINPEYTNQLTEAYQSISNRQQELKAAAAALPGLYKQFEADLKVLDSTYVTLRKQAAETPNRDVLIKAMIQNLQLQAELLGRQLMIMKEFKNKQTQKNETSI